MTFIKSMLVPPLGADPKDPDLLLRRAFRKPFFRRLLPPYVGSSTDTVFGIRFYGHPAYDRRWFKLTVGTVHSLLQKVDAAYYWLHYRTDGRYHVVRTGLEPGNYDVDYLMFVACFALLGRFVERELGIATVDDVFMYRGYRIHSGGGTDEQAIDLWLWYRFEMSKQIEAFEDDFYGRYSVDFQLGTGDDPLDDETTKAPARPIRPSVYEHDYPEQLREEKLTELMKLRNHLWT